MSLKHIEGFDQLQGQVGQQLLSSLTSAGFNVSSGLAMADGRKAGSYALELQVAAGTAGDSWSSRTNNVKQELRAIACHTGGRMVAVGNAGVAVGSDDGITMLPVILGVAAQMRDIEVAVNTWIAVGTGSTILRSINGKDFSPRPSPVPNLTLNAVATDGAGKWVIAGANGAVGVMLVSVDDGVTWELATVPSGAKACLCLDYGNGVFVTGGATGQVLTSNSGTAFVAATSGITTNITAIAYSVPAVDHWLFGAGSNVYRSTTAGSTWALVASAIMAGTINSIDYADGRWMLVGTSGQIRVTDDEDTFQTPGLTGIGTTTLNCVYAAHGVRNGWLVVGGLNVTVNPAQNRTAVIYVSLAPPTRITRTYTPEGKFVIGWAHRATARGRILSIQDVIDIDWPAGISMGGESGQAVPARNIWYYYELEIDRVALVATLRINNVLDVTCPLDPAVADAEQFVVSWVSENGAVTRIDDIYMVDEATPNGEELVTFLGPISIPLRLPDNDVLAEWTTASGTSHWTMVGLLPPSDASFIRSAISGQKDLFTSSTPLPDGAGEVDAPILAVGIIALAQKGDIDNRQLGIVLGPEGPTQKVVTDTTLSVVPEYSQAIFEKAPGDEAWDAENTATAVFGVVVKP